MTELVALSDAMREVVALSERVAKADANLLITGESGAGKEAVAMFIHLRSKRSARPVVKIDCAALPAELLEAELFGYERGAFTGATEAKPGRLEAAHQSTLILDEIAHLSFDAQAKLLRVIERKEFERLGGRRTIRVDARLVALTNVDLSNAVRRRAFREDLFYRLNVVHIKVPPLRERLKDVRRLSKEFLKTYAAKHSLTVEEIAPEAIALLEEYSWPGNARELANTIERAVIVAGSQRIEAEDLPEALRAAVAVQQKRRNWQTLAEVEAEHIRETMQAVRGNKSEAARLLGISRKNLYERLAKMENQGGRMKAEG